MSKTIGLMETASFFGLKKVWQKNAKIKFRAPLRYKALILQIQKIIPDQTDLTIIEI